jgi:hypothetical protein
MVHIYIDNMKTAQAPVGDRNGAMSHENHDIAADCASFSHIKKTNDIL